MIITSNEKQLCQILQAFPARFGYRYTEKAKLELQQTLFRSLVAGRDEWLQELFKGNVPDASAQEWDLGIAQGFFEGTEYTEGARGKPCGHIFRNGEATIRCKTCTTDDTCVLCSRCFDASDHEDHVIFVSISPGNSGCCDCGDPEAWKRPVNCTIHTEHSADMQGKQREMLPLPEELVDSIRMTIGRAFDYLCDVVSCSPEHLRQPKSEESIRQDEKDSHLASKWYEDFPDNNPEFALLLWNDEKHTVDEVEHQVAKACRTTLKIGHQKAMETDNIGRSVLDYSTDVQKLLKIAKIIEDIKITVTIRSARDTFREEMCGTIISWLKDISGCSVRDHLHILRNVICEEMLKSWRTGSPATNRTVGAEIDDHAVESEEEAAFPIFFRATAERGLALAPLLRAAAREAGEPELALADDTTDHDEDNDSQGDADEMDEDPTVVVPPELPRDVDMRTEDETEMSEATMAGYPPPPPPPPPAPRPTEIWGRGPSDPSQSQPTSESESTVPIIPNLPSQANIDIPITPKVRPKKAIVRPPDYWLETPEAHLSREPVDLCEDLRQRIRLDYLILYDLRLWKSARVKLRDLYISTVVSVPYFKRILGLRFAGLYTVLAQLYLVADREPDHSIISLSVQMLTTPSITNDVVERGNFLTNLIAILYTFLTTRQVGHPWNMSIDATLSIDPGSVTNRRLYHFFQDLRYLLGSQHVQEKLRSERRYVLQFLDLIRLPQGICPNARAVGEHLEYETDAWIGASLLTKEINKLCRHFADCFKWRGHKDAAMMTDVIRTVAQAAIINSTGAERFRFDQAEMKAETQFKVLEPFDFDARLTGKSVFYTVVDFVVDKESISFHHALHYTLSWLIDHGKSLPRDTLRSILHFEHKDLRASLPLQVTVPKFDSDSYLMALFDFPLRVCAWLAQMKAGIWVRNGLSLRHQMSTYRNVANRDLAHQRDIFLLQTALVICDPSRLLAAMIDRFGLEYWMRGIYVVRDGYEPNQQLDIAEDLIHLLIVLISDRIPLLIPEDGQNPQVLALRRDIAHTLCFRPLPFSTLSERILDKSQDQDEFQDILADMTTFKAPEGLSDSGIFELKQECLEEIDPHIAHYNKNQRDDAEHLYKAWMAKRLRKPETEVVLEPKFIPIRSGLFTNLSAFTATPLFAQIIYFSLMLPVSAQKSMEILNTRVETFLQVVLHLMLAAVLEDKTDEEDAPDSPSFTSLAIEFVSDQIPSLPTIMSVLVHLMGNEEIKACHPKIRLILHRMRQRRPKTYAFAVRRMDQSTRAVQGLLQDSLGVDSPQTPLSDDAEARQRQAQAFAAAKKQQALARQAKVLAQFEKQQENFLANNIDWGVDDDDTDSVISGMTETRKKLWKYPSDNCILCQEETNDSRLFGTFGFMTESKLVRRTPRGDPDFLGEIFAVPASLDRSADSLRPFGVAGQNREQVQKMDAEGHDIKTKFQGLGRGFPSDEIYSGPVTTGCGHIMHYGCFHEFCRATERRQNHQIARNHPEKLDRKEFVCPLCKALGNTFLPIIWKGKEELYPGVLHTESSLEEWLDRQVGAVFAESFRDESFLTGRRYGDRFVTYINQNLNSALAKDLYCLSEPAPKKPISPLRDEDDLLSGRRFLEPATVGSTPRAPAIAQPSTLIIQELVMTFTRISETMISNKLTPESPASQAALLSMEQLGNIDTLTKTFAHSITSAEIASRGTEGEPGSTLLSKIPSSVSTHLRIFSETVSSYIAVGCIGKIDETRISKEFAEQSVKQLRTLFIGHLFYTSAHSGRQDFNDEPLLRQDAFEFLTLCSMNSVPAYDLNMHHIVEVCYYLELVRVANWITTLSWDNFIDQYSKGAIPGEALKATYGFIKTICALRKDDYNTDSVIQEAGSTPLAAYSEIHYAAIYSAFAAYSLTFLRKVTILLHVRFGLEFPNTGYADFEESELDRLTRTLRLPTVLQMLNRATTNDPAKQGGSSAVQALIVGWMTHDNFHPGGRPNHYSPLHPGIYELIGLPERYDTLTHEAIKRKCPSTGKDMTDPCLCLFCGAIVCSQAVCCTKKINGIKKGGCTQHIMK